MADVSHERRDLNDKIGQAFISTCEFSMNILMYKQTERGIAVIDLYEGFFSNFALLVILTANLKEMQQTEDRVNKALDWIMQKFNSDKDETIHVRCLEGFRIFMDYSNALSDQGVIALPSR